MRGRLPKDVTQVPLRIFRLRILAIPPSAHKYVYLLIEPPATKTSAERWAL